jgi:ankyrin repeat protein
VNFERFRPQRTLIQSSTEKLESQVKAQNGHEMVVRLLLIRDDVDPNSKSVDGVTLLTIASENGHETVVRLLLGRNDIIPDSNCCRS